MWGPAGFYTGTGASTGSVAHNVTSAHTISGLTANTAYDFYVRDSCGPTDLSGWAGPVTIQTLCSVYSTPYLENFDAVPLTCWTPSGSRQFSSYSLGAGYAMRGNFWSWSSGTAQLTSPPLTISSAAQVSFEWSHQFNTSYPNDQLVLLVRSTISTSWDTLVDLSGQAFDTPGSSTTSPGTFITETVTISSTYIGQNVVFRFDGISGYGPDVFFDNFFVSGQCAAPTNVSISTPGCADASITWSPGSQAIMSILEYGPAGFSLGQGISVNNMGLSSSGMLTLTGLNPGTAYDVYVRDSCPGSLTTWSAPTSFTTANAPLPTVSPSYTVTSLNPVTMDFVSGASGQDSTGWYFSDGTTAAGDSITHIFITNGPGTAIAFAQNACGIISDTLNFTVGIEDLNFSNFRLYPNPTMGKFDIEFDIGASNDIQFRIMTLTGNLILDNNEYHQSGRVKKSFDLSNLSAGIYLLQIKSDMGVKTYRFIIDN